MRKLPKPLQYIAQSKLLKQNSKNQSRESNQGDDIAGGYGENIGTGDLVPALGHGVDGRLGLDHGVKSVSGEGEIVRIVLFRRVVRRRRHDYRSIATLHVTG